MLLFLRTLSFKAKTINVIPLALRVIQAIFTFAIQFCQLSLRHNTLHKHINIHHRHSTRIIPGYIPTFLMIVIRANTMPSLSTPSPEFYPFDLHNPDLRRLLSFNNQETFKSTQLW